jgi:hypothetical protein
MYIFTLAGKYGFRCIRMRVITGLTDRFKESTCSSFKRTSLERANGTKDRVIDAHFRLMKRRKYGVGDDRSGEYWIQEVLFQIAVQGS